jgi:hypothetical protein
MYGLRLFQMLPILQVLDKDRADSLLQTDAETQTALARYPQGMQSLDPGHYQDTPAEKEESSIYGVRYRSGEMPPDSTESLNQQVDNEIERRLNLISLECSKYPKQALTDAMNLPQSSPVQSGVSSPRLVALMNVANRTVEQEPTIARTALDESRKNLEGVQPFQKGRSLAEATQLYLKLGETESAKRTLQELLKVAEHIYAEDTNADDPNQAFKGQWPSAFLWVASVRLAARISPELAEQTVSSVTDHEIAATVRVGYACSLLGSLSDFSEVVEWHKKGHRMYSLPAP